MQQKTITLAGMPGSTGSIPASAKAEAITAALEDEYLTNPAALFDTLTAEDSRTNAAAAAMADLANPTATVESMMHAAYKLRRIIEQAVQQDAANMAEGMAGGSIPW